MFDFENLIAYKRAKVYYLKILDLIKSHNSIDPVLKNQIKRSSSSIVLNIAEGTSRFSKADKKNFYTIARGSLFETIAAFDLLREERVIENEIFQSMYIEGEELSKILYAMIRNLQK